MRQVQGTAIQQMKLDLEMLAAAADSNDTFLKKTFEDNDGALKQTLDKNDLDLKHALEEHAEKIGRDLTQLRTNCAWIGQCRTYRPAAPRPQPRRQLR